MHAATSPRTGGLAVPAALLLVYVVWGSTYLGIRIALEHGVPPLLVTSGLRFVVAGALLLGVLRLRGVAAPTRAQWKNLVIMGALLLGMGNALVVLAETTVSSAWRRWRWPRCRCGWGCSACCAASAPRASSGSA